MKNNKLLKRFLMSTALGAISLSAVSDAMAVFDQNALDAIQATADIDISVGGAGPKTLNLGTAAGGGGGSVDGIQYGNLDLHGIDGVTFNVGSVLSAANGGAGGIFEFNNKKYGTALEGETVPKDRVEVGKTTAPLMGDEYYKKDPRLATLRQQDDDRQLLARAEAQKKEMKEFKPTESLDVLPVPTKPLSSLVFKTAPLNPKTNSRVEPVSYTNIETNSKKLKKKSYGGNLAMLKYMK